jgi:hypothetical protein
MHRFALALCLSATTAQAEPPLSAEAFDALTIGRTMTWAEDGVVYGVEHYLPGRQVRWTVLGDDCKAGHWYPEGNAICFQYEDDPAPDCWEITLDGPGMLARYTANPPDTPPVVVVETTTPMACFGPKVGT